MNNENNNEALTFLRTDAAAISEEDDCTICEHMVDSELRKLNHINKAIAKNTIQNFIFKLQMEEMSSQTLGLLPRSDVHHLWRNLSQQH